jgi:hypothetical protein
LWRSCNMLQQSKNICCSMVRGNGWRSTERNTEDQKPNYCNRTQNSVSSCFIPFRSWISLVQTTIGFTGNKQKSQGDYGRPYNPPIPPIPSEIASPYIHALYNKLWMFHIIQYNPYI